MTLSLSLQLSPTILFGWKWLFNHLHRSIMDVKFWTCLVILSQFSVAHSAHVSGTITENVTFFLPEVTSCSIYTDNNRVQHYYLRMSISGTEHYPLIGIYATKINIAKQCSYIRYGQLRNENLHPFLRVGRYRTTTCELSGTDTQDCRGKVVVQDYIPRNFHLTFGFRCYWPRIHFLQGLEYNISFSKQSNSTNVCINYSMLWYTESCTRFYNETSLPNLVGDEHVEQSVSYFKESVAYDALLLQYGTCYEHFSELVCYVLLPKCDRVNQQVTHPWIEMCRDIIEGCWEKLSPLIAFRRPGWSVNRDRYYQLVNCDYLPSLHGSVPCFYKPVTCDSRPDVTNGAAILSITQKDVYTLHDVVQYACVN